MPAISVIVPTYNCGRWLAESLASVLGQSLPPREVIVVDDGSTDDTARVLESFVGRIQVVNGSHGGLAAARNLGLSRATSEWIAFHDADDIAFPDRLSWSATFLSGQPDYDAVFSDGERMEAPDPARARVIPVARRRQAIGHRLGANEIFDGFPIYFQGALVPRRAFHAAGRFNPSYRVQPDIEYGYRLLSQCRATFVDRVSFRYRWHTTNNSADRLGGREDIARILEALPDSAPDVVGEIGVRRLRWRLARHWFRIGSIRVARKDLEAARMALRRAAALRPLHPRYQWARLRYGA